MNPGTVPRPASFARTVFRLRCPLCGRGVLFARLFTMHERCTACGFVYNRGNSAYFSGAIFLNYLLGAGSALVVFLITLLATWPAVPWTLISYAGPVVALALILAIHPLAKALLLAIDVRMRPITAEELRDGGRPPGE